MEMIIEKALLEKKSWRLEVGGKRCLTENGELAFNLQPPTSGKARGWR
jgi:hypothetical protein